VIAIPSSAPVFPHTCRRCGFTGPASPDPVLSAFGWDPRRGRPRRWCRACDRADVAIRREDPAYRERQRQQCHDYYHGKGRAVRLAWLAAHASRKRELIKAYFCTPRGKIVKSRQTARRKLRRATSEAQRVKWAAVVKACELELDRLGGPGRCRGTGEGVR